MNIGLSFTAWIIHPKWKGMILNNTGLETLYENM